MGLEIPIQWLSLLLFGLIVLATMQDVKRIQSGIEADTFL